MSSRPHKKLSWRPGYTLSKRPLKRVVAHTKKQSGIEFILENPQGNWLSGQDGRSASPSKSVSESTSNLSTYTTESRARDTPVEEVDNHISSTEPVLVSSSVVLSDKFTSVQQTVTYISLTLRFKPVLERYNNEFCMIPLTFQLRNNPFRYHADVEPEPTFLVHAVMALAGHHVDSSTMLDHKHMALQFLRQSFAQNSRMETMHSLLDTIIILFSLEETQTIFGNWSAHLSGAYSTLEACGGIKQLTMTPRLTAQIGILTWWDAIISLLSREPCIFPYSYFQAVLSTQASREWDFFSLCGCPTSLVKIVMRLARANSSHNSPATHETATYETLITNIISELNSWSHPPLSYELIDEKSIHIDLDTLHCSSAWRSGLLLYIHRVHPSPSFSPPAPSSTLYLARSIIDHILSCRSSTMVSRQALLPIFLAGCELQDVGIRRVILDLCREWDRRTRYHMFAGGVELLREVWAVQEKGEGVWWGDVVDRWHGDEGTGQVLKMRVCFG